MYSILHKGGSFSGLTLEYETLERTIDVQVGSGEFIHTPTAVVGDILIERYRLVESDEEPFYEFV